MKKKGIILFLGIIQYLSQPFIQDLVSILQKSILSKLETKYSKSESINIYTILNSSYNLPNLFFPLMAGIINDLYGYRVTLIIYQMNLVCGSLLMFFCFQFFESINDSMLLGFLGRFLLGMSDSIEIPTFSLIVHWFHQDQTMSAAMQMISYYCMPRIAVQNSLDHAMLIAFFVSLLSAFFALLLLFFDKCQFKKQINYQTNTQNMIHQLFQLPKIFWYSILSSNFMVAIYYSFQIFQIQLIENQLLQKEIKYSLKQLTHQESFLTSLTYLIQIPIYPLLGIILDKYGQRIKLMFLSVFILFLSFNLFNKQNLVFSMLLNGIFLSQQICVSRSIFQFIGLGLGLINMLTSFLIITFNFIASQTKQNQLMYFYLSLILINFILCKITYNEDKKRLISLDSNQNLVLEQLIEKELFIKRNQVLDLKEQQFTSQQLQNTTITEKYQQFQLQEIQNHIIPIKN